jgi:hypothetical protein
MPSLIQNYNADYRSITRFYSPTVSGRGGGGGFGFGDAAMGSPEKRKRQLSIVQDYQKKLAAVNFNQLPQECKADYILFKRDLAERALQINLDAEDYEKLKKLDPVCRKNTCTGAASQEGPPARCC